MADEPTKAEAPPASGPEAELGGTGLEIWSGYVREEFLRELQGQRAAKVYREMSDNSAVVGALLFAIKMLIRGVPWRVEAGGAGVDDERAAEFLRSCQSDMEHTWSEFIDEVLSMLPYGFSLHEVVLKRRLGMQPPEGEATSKHDDGRIGWRKLPIRGQTTIADWVTTPRNEVTGAWQSAPPTFARVELPLTRCLLFRPSTHKDSPEGRSILRTAYRPWYFGKHMENLEGIGAERDLVGIPTAWVPTHLLKSGASAADKAIAAGFQTLVKNIKQNEQAGLVMPLEYDEKGNKRFDITLLSVASRRLFDTGAIIDRYNRQIAMTVLADFILLGHEAVGSFALSDSKTSLFSVAIGAWLDAISDVLNRTAVPRLFALNPEFARAKLPRFQHDDIETPDLTSLGAYITALSGAGASLFPDNELENFLRRAGGMPEVQDDGGAGGAPMSEEAEKRAFFAYQLDAGMITINEARAREGLEPVAGGDVTLPAYRAAHPDWQWSAQPGGAVPFAASAVRKAILRLPHVRRPGR